MVDARNIPSFVGYRPEEAEAAAADLGLSVVWVEIEAPRWLSPRNEPRVGRQRIREDGTLELLRVLIPTMPEEIQNPPISEE